MGHPSDANPGKAGESIAFTAYVEATKGNGIPSGTVEFVVDGRVEAHIVLDDSGHAVYVDRHLTPGRHVIIAIYAGDPETYFGSAGNLIETIRPKNRE